MDGYLALVRRAWAPLWWIDRRIQPRADKHLITRLVWSAVSTLAFWIVLPVVAVGYLIPVAGCMILLSIFWTAPTVIWLSVAHDVPASDSFSYALMLANGRPEYEGPFGVNNDPSTIGFFLFNVVAWGLVIAPIYG